MNENSSSNSSTSASHHGLTAEAISRRAYELWEQEGRPENRDLHHWLRAEQELLAEQNKSGTSSSTTAARPVQNTDQPLQAARTGAPAPKGPPKRNGGAATTDTKPQTPSRSTQPGMRTAGRG